MAPGVGATGGAGGGGIGGMGGSEPAGDAAFIGAEGWGATAVGGRGGRVIVVTNLNWDVNDPGSLAYALAVTEPRTIVFEVSGVIDVTESIPLGPEHSYVTIAGQTSPGGITLRGVSGAALQSYVQTATGDDDVFHDAVVRFVRFRGQGNDDNVQLAPTHHVIFDHCDFSGASDETLDIGYAHDVTIQWSTLSNSGPGQQYAFLLAYAPTTRISYHHNFTAHHMQRCVAQMHWGDEGIPLANGGGVPAGGVDLEFRNNVIHNCAFASTFDAFLGEGTENVRINFVGNTATHGADVYQGGPIGMTWFHDGQAPRVQLFLDDNHYDDHPMVNLENEAPPTRLNVAHPDATIAVTTTSAEVARTAVLDGVGAWPRDAMTARIIDEARSGTGAIGTFDDPLISGGPAPPADVDRDGMSDAWEADNGLDVGTDDSSGDADGDGWTNLEEYLHARAQQLLSSN